MDSKGNVRHFFGVLFAWRGFESCCCSGVSEPASKGLAPKRRGRGFESCCCLSVSEALRQRLSKLETLALVGVPREAALYLL